MAGHTGMGGAADGVVRHQPAQRQGAAFGRIDAQALVLVAVDHQRPLQGRDFLGEEVFPEAERL